MPGTETTITDAGAPSAAAGTQIEEGNVDFNAGLFETIGIQEAPKTDKPEDQPGKTQETPEEKAAADKAAADKTLEDTGRYDQIPRFQELLQRAVAAETKLQMMEQAPIKPDGAKAEAGGEPAKKTAEELGFKDIAEMSPEDIQDWQDEDPKGYAANLLKQAKYEIKQEMATETEARTQEATVEKTYQSYADSNPDFLKKWEAGEIQGFMAKNPGAITAHLAMSAENRIKEAVAKAEKDTEAKIYETLKAKGTARTLSAGPADAGHTVESESDELKNPEKYGGPDKVLLDRFLRRQRGST
ncbi:MAG: hypothetical protein KKF30_07445 [Proteobacteria bacterium]|nr:hypothetical protein [Pseudomonadota bacterium]MBU4470298.1 hypothetical protein [Pseudomonadota bacterium]MCG2752710.1 hypothetical protein [Desulfobacteraceae bacterium]